ncbi:hypothetical protein RHGRI_006067 [Rhododendron griersonianum]|uniref:Uncharacterized protein n=1 Tax=Rhododendron griersonianum TaxID=479676 RepID=A0AAV6LFE4_9ERIC|nr:hypothetical protein RHGRI_006067 [Rhododendron griersonianum]
MFEGEKEFILQEDNWLSVCVASLYSFLPVIQPKFLSLLQIPKFEYFVMLMSSSNSRVSIEFFSVAETGGSRHIRIMGCLFRFENPVFWVPLDFDDTHLLATIGIAATGTFVARLVFHVPKYVQCNVESQQESGFFIQMKRCNFIDSSTNQPYGNIWAEIPFVMDIIIQIINIKFFDLLSKRVYGRLIPYMYHQKSKELTWEHFGLCRMIYIYNQTVVMILSRPASLQ